MRSRAAAPTRIAVFVQADHGRREHLTQSVWHQFDPVTPDSDQAMGGTEIDTDDHRPRVREGPVKNGDIGGDRAQISWM